MSTLSLTDTFLIGGAAVGAWLSKTGGEVDEAALDFMLATASEFGIGAAEVGGEAVYKGYENGVKIISQLNQQLDNP